MIHELIPYCKHMSFGDLSSASPRSTNTPRCPLRYLARVEKLQRPRLRARAFTMERRVPSRGGLGPQQLQPQDHRRAVLQRRRARRDTED